jgi:uncharacterized membrane protein
MTKTWLLVLVLIFLLIYGINDRVLDEDDDMRTTTCYFSTSCIPWREKVISNSENDDDFQRKNRQNIVVA